MKKFLSLLMMTLLCVSAWAETVTYDLNSTSPGTWSEWANNTTSCTVDDVTFTIVKGSDGSTANMLQSGHIRLYNGSTLTIESDKPITEIKLWATTTQYADGLTWTTNTGGTTVEHTQSGNMMYWKGSATTVTASMPAQIRANKIDITFDEPSTEFGINVSPAAGTYTEPVEFKVDVLNATEGYEVTYKLDGGQEQTYTAPVMLYKSTEVEVYALDGDGATDTTWTGIYTINLPALELAVTPDSGTYPAAFDVTVSAANGIEGLGIDYLWEFTPANGNGTTNGESATINISESGMLYLLATEQITGRTADITMNYVIDANMPVPTNKYQLVTGIDQLEDGKNYIILTTEGDAAMGSISNSKGTKATGYTLNGDGTVATLTDNTDVMVLTLSVNDGDATTAPTYKLGNDGTYITLGTNTNINMGVGTDLNISIDADNVATIQNPAATTRAILFQYGTANLFGNYALSNLTNPNAAYGAVYLYKQIEETPETIIDIAVTITPEGGTYYQPQMITITTDPAELPEGLTLKYQINYAGSDTEGEWLAYTEPFALRADALVTADVFDANGQAYEGSMGTEQEYTFVTPVITVTPAGGTYYSAQTVTATCEPMPEGAVLLYSIWDDEEEEFIANGEELANGITIDQTCDLYVWLKLADGTQLAETNVVESYTILTPEITVSPEFGTYEGTQTVLVTVTNMPNDGVISYLLEPIPTNGAMMAAPAEETPYDAGGIEVTQSSTLTIYVRDTQGTELANVSGRYIINETGTGVEGVVAGKPVKTIRYYNVAGQQVSKADGVSIMVIEFEDGTKSVSKVVK